MHKIMSIVIVGVVSLISTMSIAADPASKMTGSLEVRIENVPIVPAPGYGNAIQAAVGLEILNTSSEPMRIALMGSLTLQLDDGTNFGEHHRLSGIELCRQRTLQECERSVEEFEVLAPSQSAVINVVWLTGSKDMRLERVRFARMSGSLFVRNQATGKSWKQNISLKDIPVDNRLR